jgi:hypothetical protein
MLLFKTNINMGFTINWMSGKGQISGDYKRKLRSGGRPELDDGWMMGLEPTTLRTTI